MEKVHTLEDFYLQKLDCVPQNIKKDIGHFNVFRTEDFLGQTGISVPYSRKDYYKVSLVIGRNSYHYADKSIEIKKAGIVFASPMIPYRLERLDARQSGYFCVFTKAFLSEIPGIKDYPIFKPGSFPIYELEPGDLTKFLQLFDEMTLEINTDYAYKYDLLRALVQQVIHAAMKLKPNPVAGVQRHSANDRITSLFIELLERQFPKESPSQRMKLRAPVDFAEHLSVHINHLNRSLKTITTKTTSQLIADRVLQESRTLLKHTDWNIAEIGYCLGFNEPSHFISFFKKAMLTTPRQFRA